MKFAPRSMKSLLTSPPVKDRRDLYARYVPLVEFLGQAVGPNCEIVLHDLTVPDESIIAIVNGHISGRKMGGPVTNFALWFMRQGASSSVPYVAGYRAVNGVGRICRSSSYFIRDENDELIGMICTNVDITDFVQFQRFIGPQIGGASPVIAEGYEQFVDDLPIPDPISDQFGQPDAFDGLPTIDEVKQRAVEEMTSNMQEADSQDATMENLHSNLDTLFESMLSSVLVKHGADVDNLSLDDRLHIVAELDDAGFYLLKGGISATATKLGVSEATVYRYLVRVRG
ncbi:helix-turn-helix transcriptional regulator [Corynebacterium sp. H128]|uniref:helix-turn-helix transcriptional regulator n=1 Tax=unclassified Corynebacterium TaxID=2624378 RepID=UPI0030A0F504